VRLINNENIIEESRTWGRGVGVAWMAVGGFLLPMITYSLISSPKPIEENMLPLVLSSPLATNLISGAYEFVRYKIKKLKKEKLKDEATYFDFSEKISISH